MAEEQNVIEEGEVMTRRVCIAIPGTPKEFMNATPKMLIDPAIFTANSENKHIVFKSISLVQAVNTAPFPIGLIMTHDNVRIGSAHKEVVEGRNAEVSSLVVLLANTQQDHQTAPVKIAGRIGAGQTDETLMQLYRTKVKVETLMDNVYIGKTAKGKEYFQIPANHPIITVLRSEYDDLNDQFDHATDANTGNIQVAKKLVMTGKEIITKKLASSPIVRSDGICFNAACIAPTVYAGYAASCTSLCQINVVLDIEYKLV